jgi:hypothetical protein
MSPTALSFWAYAIAVPIPFRNDHVGTTSSRCLWGPEFVAESLSPWTVIEYWFEARNVCDVVLSAFTVMDTRHQ